MSFEKDKYLYLGIGTALCTLWVVHTQNLWSDMWANLVTELVGILITVGWLDRRIRKQEVKKIKPSMEYVYQNIIIFFASLNWDLSTILNHEEYDADRIENAVSGIFHYTDNVNRYLDKYPEIVAINHRTKLDRYLENIRLFAEIMRHNMQGGDFGNFEEAYEGFKYLFNYQSYWEIREELIEYYKKTFPEETEFVKLMKGIGKRPKSVE